MFLPAMHLGCSSPPCLVSAASAGEDCTADSCTAGSAAHDALRPQQVVARAAEMALRLGWFFASLALDRASGASDDSTRVRTRAAQLRCAPLPCC